MQTLKNCLIAGLFCAFTLPLFADPEPIAGVMIEEPSWDAANNGQSTFFNSLNQTKAAGKIDYVFLDIGSIDTHFFPSTTPLNQIKDFSPYASGTCGTVTLFNYFAPAYVDSSYNPINNANCQDFDNIQPIYAKTGAKVILWISSTDVVLPQFVNNTFKNSGDQKAALQFIANTIAYAVNNDPNIVGIGIESSGVMGTNPQNASDPLVPEFQVFYQSLVSALHPDRMLFVYEAPLPYVGSILQSYANTVITDPLYDFDNPGYQTYDFGQYQQEVTNQMTNPSYKPFKLMMMIPASGQDTVWQNFKSLNTNMPKNKPDPIVPVPSTNPYTVGACSNDDGTPPANCIEYVNTNNPSPYNADNLQDDYVLSALCGIGKNISSQPNFMGVLYYNVRPAGFWYNNAAKHSGTPNYGTFPESIEAGSLNILGSWLDSPQNLCNT